MITLLRFYFRTNKSVFATLKPIQGTLNIGSASRCSQVVLKHLILRTSSIQRKAEDVTLTKPPHASSARLSEPTPRFIPNTKPPSRSIKIRHVIDRSTCLLFLTKQQISTLSRTAPSLSRLN